MEYRGDDGSNEERDFHENRGCFKPGDERVCDKRGPNPDGMPGNYDDQRGPDGGQFRDNREGRFEGDGPSGFDRPDFDRDDSNRGGEDEERHRHRRDD